VWVYRSAQYRVTIEEAHIRSNAAKMIERMLRGWIVRATIASFKAAIKVQGVYRRWKANARRRAAERKSGGSPGGGASLLTMTKGSAKSAAQPQERPSRILARGRKLGLINDDKGASGAFMNVVMEAAAQERRAVELKQREQLVKATPRSMSTNMGTVSKETATLVSKVASKQRRAAETDAELDSDSLKFAEAATRIQSRAVPLNRPPTRWERPCLSRRR
jgi:hypothetical protein